MARGLLIILVGLFSSGFLPFLLASSSSSSSSSSSVLEYSPDDLLSEDRLLALFDAWNLNHGKVYTVNGLVGEKQKRFETFKTNLAHIHSHNSRQDAPPSFLLGLNRFADVSNEEFKARFHGLSPSLKIKKKDILLTNPAMAVTAGSKTEEPELACMSSSSFVGLPQAWDWRKEGVVTPVKDQGSCGSCWAFSATGAIEGIYALKTGKLVSVSEQEIVSCDLNGESYGCRGGWMDDAFQWVIKNGGITSEAKYPYKGYDSPCNISLLLEKDVTIDDYAEVPANNEQALFRAVAQQPVSVAIDASTWDFQLYYKGVFSGACSSNPYMVDHAVLIVGWDSINGMDYWIVKNSWGEDWGMDGYIHMIRDGTSPGICSINSFATYPIKLPIQNAASL